MTTAPHVVRLFKSILFVLVMLLSLIVQSNLRGADRGINYPLSLWLAIGGIAAIVLLAVGWLLPRTRIAEIGLALTIGVYVARAAFVWHGTPFEQAGFGSLVIAFLAGMALNFAVEDRKVRGRGDQ